MIFNDQELSLRVYVLSGISVPSHYVIFLRIELLQLSEVRLEDRSPLEDMY